MENGLAATDPIRWQRDEVNLKLTHTLLSGWLQTAHAVAKAHLHEQTPWPDRASPQSNWTLWAHLTLRFAFTHVYPVKRTKNMSLRVSQTKDYPTLWSSAVTGGLINDHTTQQQGVDFCLMGPTGQRVHFLTAESECSPNDSVAISLGRQGYVWDWQKLLGDMSEHRLLFAVVGGNRASPPGAGNRPDVRRSTLIANMKAFFAQTHSNIKFQDGIGGYILAHHAADRADTFTFVVRKGQLSFKRMPLAAGLI